LPGLLLASAPALAQVTCPVGGFTWNDGAGAWATGTNWTPVGPPTAGGDVCFNTATANPALPAGTTTVGSVNVLSTGNLTLTGGALRNFTINGGINADGPLAFNNILNVSPSASQAWLLNGSGNVFNSPLSVPVAIAATTTITVTGAGDLTFNNAAPRGFQAFNWGAANVLSLNANGLGAGTQITLSGANAAILIGSAAALNLDNPVTATTSGELVAVDGNVGVRQSFGLLTIAAGQTVEELPGSANNVQAQPAGLTLGAGSTLLKQTFGGIYVNGTVSDTATNTLNLLIGLITPTGSQLDEGLHFLSSTTVNSTILSNAAGNSAMLGADGAVTLTLAGAVNLGAGGRLILIPRSGGKIVFSPSSFTAPGNANDIQLRGTAGNSVEFTNSAVTANAVTVFDGLTFQSDSSPPPPTVTFSTTGGASWLVRNAAQTLSGSLAMNAAGTVDTGTNLTITGVLAGSGALTKVGAGSLVLGPGTHTHNGGITVNAGTLEVDGTLTGEGAIAINNGGGLAGAGTLQSNSGPIAVAGGASYSPGSAGAGNLTTNDVNLSDTSVLNFTVGTATTQGIVNGALVLDGILNINQGPGFAQGTFTLFTATGAITNNALRLGTASNSFSYDYAVSGNSVLLKVGPGATAVELVKMEAVSDGTSTAVTWEAGTEIRNIGYRVYREENGRRREVSGLIAGAALRGRGDMVAGRNYAFVDPAGRPGAQYWVQAVDLNGQSQWLGPVAVRHGPSSKVGVRSAALVTQLQPAALLASDPGSSGRPTDPPGLDRSLRDLDVKRQWQVAASIGAVKLLVRQDGVYRVSSDQLVQAGLPAGTSLGAVQLWRGGRPVAFRVVSSAGKDAIEFFGQAADTRYTDTHVYWVTPSLGKPVPIRPAPPANATASASSFLETLEIRQRMNHVSALQNPDTNELFGPAIAGTTPLERVFSTPALAVLSGEPAVLEVSIQALTEGIRAVDVVVNGLRVGTIQTVYTVPATARFTLPPGTVVPGNNKVDLVGQTGSVLALEISQRLTYPRLYTFGGPLRFTVPAGEAVTLSGADSSTHVLDITEALGPSSVATTMSGDGARLTASGTGTRILYAYRDQDVLGPTVVTNAPSSWHAAQGSDLVIIGARDLLASLQPLVQQRVGEGLSVAVVDIQDVYDEFSAGEKDALAIRSFLATALQRWAVSPSFVLLAGAATYDPRGWTLPPELDEVPTVFVWSLVQEAPSDDALVTFDAGAGPALAIGRLPMSTPADMQAAVAKIVGRRLATHDDGLLFVRGNDDNPPPFPFSAASAEVQAALSGWKAQDLVRGPDPTANGAALMDALDAGPVAVDYQGHGTEDHWGGGFLSTADTDTLARMGTTALISAATCLNGYFIDPDRESLGAALLRTPGGGAWAVWANSAWSVPTEHAIFSKTVLSAVLNDGLTLGEATLKAKQALTDSNVRSTFHLFGDPSARAVAVRSSALTLSSPRSGASGCSTSGEPLAALAPLVLGLLALSRRRRRPT
jgi:uncharacterized protein (TIGR03382 family)